MRVADFLTVVFLVRALGLERFGLFGFVWMVVLFGGALQESLFSLPIRAARRRVDTRRTDFAALLVIEGAFLATVFAWVWVACGIALPALESTPLAGGALPIAFLVCAKMAQSFVSSVLYSNKRPVAAKLNHAIAYVGQLGFVAVLALNSQVTILNAIWAIAIPFALASCVGLVRYPSFFTRVDDVLAVLHEYWNAGRLTCARAILQWFSTHYFLIAVGGFLGSASLGALLAAHAILGLLHAFFSGLRSSVHMRAARIHATLGLGGLARYMERVAWSGTVPVLFLSVALITWPRPLLDAFYGQSTMELVAALRGFAVLYVFLFQVSFLEILMRSLGRGRSILIAYASASALAVILAHPLVEAFGSSGAIAGMVLQELCISAILFTGLFRLLNERVLLAPAE